MTRPSARLAVVAAAIALGVGWPADAGVVRVPISLPLPARMDTAGIQTILVVQFLASDHPDIAISQEMVRLVRRLLEKGTPFRILDVEPPNLPEQNLQDLIQNREFWREMGRRYGADLILSGDLRFDTEDLSGFVTEDYVSPVTGQRVRRTRYAERQSFELNLDLLIFRGATGDLAYQDRYQEQTLTEGKTADHFQVLFDLIGRVEPEILGILVGQRRTETRGVFTN